MKLERFLQEREVVPLGSDTPGRVDVRVCAATSRDHTSVVELGLTRSDNRAAGLPLAGQRARTAEPGRTRRHRSDPPPEMRTAGKAMLTGEYGGVVEYSYALAAFELQYLGAVLQRVHGDMSEAARVAGISRGHLHRKVKLLGISRADYRDQE